MKIDISKLKKVMPCGMLYTPTGQSYILLHNKPVDRTMWQMDYQQMYLVVPSNPIETKYEKNTDGMMVGGEPIYSYPRHIITSHPTIEYKYGTETILVLDLDDVDLSNVPSHSEVENTTLDTDI